VNFRFLLELFVTWFKLGLFTFGGGFAMLPLIEKEVVEKGWATRDEILDIMAISQSVPGAIAINTAIYLGKRMAGFVGAIVAAIGVISPSVMVILAIAVYFVQFQENLYIMKAFSGIRAAIAGLITATAIRVASVNFHSKIAMTIIIGSLALNLFTSVHAAWIILLGAFVGYVVYHYLPNYK